MQLSPSLALLAPAAGPDPGASLMPRGSWGLYQPPPRHQHPTHSLLLGSLRGGMGGRLGLSKAARGTWGAEGELEC